MVILTPRLMEEASTVKLAIFFSYIIMEEFITVSSKLFRKLKSWRIGNNYTLIFKLVWPWQVILFSPTNETDTGVGFKIIPWTKKGSITCIYISNKFDFGNSKLCYNLQEW